MLRQDGIFRSSSTFPPYHTDDFPNDRSQCSSTKQCFGTSLTAAEFTRYDGVLSPLLASFFVEYHCVRCLWMLSLFSISSVALSVSYKPLPATQQKRPLLTRTLMGACADSFHERLNLCCYSFLCSTLSSVDGFRLLHDGWLFYGAFSSCDVTIDHGCRNFHADRYLPTGVRFQWLVFSCLVSVLYCSVGWNASRHNIETTVSKPQNLPIAY